MSRRRGLQRQKKEDQQQCRDASAVMGPKVIEANAAGSKHAAELVAAWSPFSTDHVAEITVVSGEAKPNC